MPNASVFRVTSQEAEPIIAMTPVTGPKKGYTAPFRDPDLQLTEGTPVLQSPDRATLRAAISEADIVQVHYFNSPGLLRFLASNWPPCRAVLWCHVCGMTPAVPTVNPIRLVAVTNRLMLADNGLSLQGGCWAIPALDIPGSRESGASAPIERPPSLVSGSYCFLGRRQDGVRRSLRAGA
jgi:hypothetical protein